MRKTIFGALLAVSATIAMVGVADAAQNYRRDGWFWRYYDERWCLSENNATALDCGYRTFEQCQFSRNGVGGTCSPNPRYVEQAPARKRKRAVR